jgi:hypothetical protein
LSNAEKGPSRHAVSPLVSSSAALLKSPSSISSQTRRLLTPQ